jgi:hypothetical protein
MGLSLGDKINMSQKTEAEDGGHPGVERGDNGKLKFNLQNYIYVKSHGFEWFYLLE